MNRRENRECVNGALTGLYIEHAHVLLFPEQAQTSVTKNVFFADNFCGGR